MVSSQYKKITQALRYLISQSTSNRINILLLMKLVWAADRYHARKYGSLITDYDYRALPKGPVSSTAYDIADKSDFLSYDQLEYSKRYVDRRDHFIFGVSPTDVDYLAETNQEALDFAWEKFGHMDKYAVVDITHKYPEWDKFKLYFEDGASSEEMDVIDFFKNPPQDAYFKEDSELLELSKARLEETLGLRKLIKG
jgi:uncharacterized phage-associated protein